MLSFLPCKLGRLLKILVLKFLLHSTSQLRFLLFLLGEPLIMETLQSSSELWASLRRRPLLCCLGRQGFPPGDPAISLMNPTS